MKEEIDVWEALLRAILPPRFAVTFLALRIHVPATSSQPHPRLVLLSISHSIENTLFWMF